MWWPARFFLHVAVMTVIAGIALYLPGRREFDVAIGWIFWLQAAAAFVNAALVEPRDRGVAVLYGFGAVAYGSCCCLVAAMSVNSSWL